MAEGRMLKKKISLNEALANLDNDTHRLLFTWAIPHLDIEGRISGSPRVFKATVAPLLDHLTPEKITKFFNDAHEKGLINRYKIGKDWWVEYPKFKENQNLRETREAASRIPSPPENSGTTPGVIQEDDSTTPAEVKRSEVNLIEEKITPPTPSRGRGMSSYSQEFEKFWDAYPKKVGRAAAWKAWQNQKRAGVLPANGKIQEAINEQLRSDQWRKEGGQFIPNPSTWLNQGRWDDKLQASGEARAW